MMEQQQESLDNGKRRQGAMHEEQDASMMKNDSEKSGATDKSEQQADASAEKIQQLTLELDEFKDKYLRAAAEMDNMRKRHAKERADFLRFGAENLLRDLLPALDSFEQACQEGAQAQEGDHYQKGIMLVRKQLFDILERHGMKAIDAVGQPFDPNLHQAIQRVDSEDVEVDQVQQEFAKGYVYNDRLLRPAMVAVAVAKKNSDED